MHLPHFIEEAFQGSELSGFKVWGPESFEMLSAPGSQMWAVWVRALGYWMYEFSIPCNPGRNLNFSCCLGL